LNYTRRGTVMLRLSMTPGKEKSRASSTMVGNR